MALFPISCTVDIRPPAENNVGAVSGTAWSLNFALMVWHPDLKHYERLMANKLARNEVDAFVYNARQYFQLTENLVEDTMAAEQSRIERYVAALSVLAVVAVLLLVIASGITKVLISTLLLPALVLLVFHFRRRTLIRELRRSAASNVEPRFQHFCETKRKKYMHTW